MPLQPLPRLGDLVDRDHRGLGLLHPVDQRLALHPARVRQHEHGVVGRLLGIGHDLGDDLFRQILRRPDHHHGPIAEERR
jgi:hypothetical protein